MNVLLIFFFMIGGFNQKWYIPRGTNGPSGRIVIEDTDRDGNYEFFICRSGGSQKIYVYELHLPDTWEVDSFPYFWGPLVWDIADFDLDGLYDLVIQTAVDTPPKTLISIAESPDSFFYPTEEVWRDTVGQGLVTPICSYDIDKDGLPEIVKVLGDYIHLHIYESIGDNLYEKIAEITTSSSHNSSSTLAFGDFDLDGQNEFIWGYSGGEYSIWECIGNNSYQEISLQQLPTSNIKDCFSVPDADGDGKMEFVVKGFTFSDGKFRVFIFEAVGDNTYEIIDTLIFSGFSNSYYGGYSDVGDVDGDGIPEIALEGSFRVYMIEADSNDNFYVFDTLPGHGSGSSVAVYDIDGNGLSEVVISGNNETRIYEYVQPGVEEGEKDLRHKTTDLRLTISPNPFRDKVVIEFWSSGVPGFNSQLPNFSTPQLTIYDACGRLVKEFSLGTWHLALGTVVTWDGKDNKGRDVRSGIYFLNIKNPETGETIKRKLLKIE